MCSNFNFYSDKHNFARSLPTIIDYFIQNSDSAGIRDSLAIAQHVNHCASRIYISTFVAQTRNALFR